MKVKITTWKVSTLYKLKDKINEQPTYQRGEVWNNRKKSILIDSMLRGIDIPKIYLRKLNTNAHEYEVADGQQRLTAIFKFIENKFSLLNEEEKGLDLNKIDGKNVGGLKFEKLPVDFKKCLNNYEVTIAIIEGATHHEIRTLFGRLQEGDPLVPAEKRNAIISNIGHLIDNYALNHSFFISSRIPANRYKRQDFMSHALALISYNNKEPLKAKLLLKMYLDKSLTISQALQKSIAVVLDKMMEIDQLSTVRIYKKYHFIDMFNFLFNNLDVIETINSSKSANVFDDFEHKRLSNYSKPEVLIENKKPSQYERDLYDYIIAFRYNGADPESINVRLRVFNNLFK
ncbi:DUF262 domain-containing protein [Geofilum rubicundum]|uniref:GmrSD restriction endonucleases N-terminal domain-containing protein n=1 Tax=Geofilum rubicundum JCM 15548 TaxID=1236989 RepID=A0A0E9LYJ6_9BACT|nr:DUF262 domain-containing protein [Geofilum rubicundum]GAO29925.1 hypothetical protein JCM15548_12160 [Geofilum rubicundum JCM 15548]